MNLDLCFEWKYSLAPKNSIASYQVRNCLFMSCIIVLQLELPFFLLVERQCLEFCLCFELRWLGFPHNGQFSSFKWLLFTCSILATHITNGQFPLILDICSYVLAQHKHIILDIVGSSLKLCCCCSIVSSKVIWFLASFCCIDVRWILVVTHVTCFVCGTEYGFSTDPLPVISIPETVVLYWSSRMYMHIHLFF